MPASNFTQGGSNVMSRLAGIDPLANLQRHSGQLTQGLTGIGQLRGSQALRELMANTSPENYVQNAPQIANLSAIATPEAAAQAGAAQKLFGDNRTQSLQENKFGYEQGRDKILDEQFARQQGFRERQYSTSDYAPVGDGMFQRYDIDASGHRVPVGKPMTPEMYQLLSGHGGGSGSKPSYKTYVDPNTGQFVGTMTADEAARRGAIASDDYISMYNIDPNKQIAGGKGQKGVDRLNMPEEQINQLQEDAARSKIKGLMTKIDLTDDQKYGLVQLENKLKLDNQAWAEYSSKTSERAKLDYLLEKTGTNMKDLTTGFGAWRHLWPWAQEVQFETQNPYYGNAMNKLGITTNR